MTIRATKQGRAYGVKAVGDGAPSDAQLALVNQFALKELSAEQVYVRAEYLAHNGIDRDGEAFDDGLLQDFANTIVGKGKFVKHPSSWDGDSGPGEGRIFDAELVRMSFDEARQLLREPDLKFPPDARDAVLLKVYWYMLRLDYDTAARTFIDKIDGGVVGDSSIGFTATDRLKIVDDAGNVIGQKLIGPGEALESSFVWLGAQPGARAVAKGANRNTDTTEEDYTMPLEQKDFDALKGQLTTAEQQVKTLQPAADGFAAIKSAVGDDLAANPEQLKQCVDDAKTYRDSVVDDLVCYDRLAGVVGDSDDDVKTAKELYNGMPLKHLATRRDALAKQYAGKGQLDEGDPNNSGADNSDGSKKGLRDATVTKNQLGA